jgi:murein DD-endopeptidase MepM/ murein hydrolase activator NlpD
VAYNKVWYHAGAPCNGCPGIGDMWRQLDAAGVPFGVYSVEGAGLLVEAARYRKAETLIYRMLATDVAEYHLSPAEAAARAWATTIARMPPELVALKDRLWIEIGNEQDKQRADWLGWYYVELAGQAAASGWRICGPGWATGEPEPEHWQTPGWLAYLRLCAARPDRLAVTVHEYSLSADEIMETSPWLVDRVRFLFEACDAHGIGHPTVFVTEAGWTHNDLPTTNKAKADIAELATLYAHYPTVKAAFLWSIIGGGDKKTLAAELNALMPWLTEYSITTRFPDVDPPPVVVPPPDPDKPIPMSNNLLKNGSFEDGWTDSTGYSTTQNPRHWTVEWNNGAAFVNPYGGQPYELGECVHKSKALLPAAERDVFIWDGNWTLKVFAGGRSFWARLKQTLELPAGRYRLSTPVWVDTYKWDGGKDYDVDPRQTEWQVKVNGAALAEWVPLVAGRKNTPGIDFDHAGGAADIAVHFRCNWAISNNLWLDGWALERVAVAPPPEPPKPPTPEPGKHKAIILKVPQDVALSEWLAAAAYAFRFRHTMTASHDDMATLLQGGNADSYVKLAWAGRQEESGQLVDDLGYRWEHVPELDAGPLDGLRLGRPFAWRYVLTSAFDAGRSYGKHEGADYDVVGGAADNAADVLCLYDGTVDRSLDTTGGYGSYVRVKHDRNGHVFYTRYAHLDKRYVEAGQWVKQGDALGEVGTTGNVTGEHVHINLEVPGYGLGGYVVADVVDPAPYIPSGAALPLYPVAATTTIDLLPYLKGDHKRQFDMGHNVKGGGTQTVQVWHLDAANWLYIKGEGGEYERLGLRPFQGKEWIFRFDDTSESPTRFYAHYLPNGGPIGAPWLPRYATVGEWYTTSKFVQHYLKAGCAKQDGGDVVDKLRVMAGPRSVTYPQSGVTLQDVITIEWSGGEQYDFAVGRGCVAFRDADRTFWFIGDLEGRPDKAYKKPGCIPLGW